jgi:hypothetical protein
VPGVPGQSPQYPPQYPPPAQYGGPAPTSKKTITWIVAAVAGFMIIMSIAGVVLVGKMFPGRDPDVAKAGDCMTGATADSLKVIKCTDAKVTYRVVGKVDNVTEVGFTMDQNVCKPFENVENAFWKGEKLGSGYVLCLARATPTSDPAPWVDPRS